MCLIQNSSHFGCYVAKKHPFTVSLAFSSLMKSSRTAKMTNREKQVLFVLNIACFA